MFQAAGAVSLSDRERRFRVLVESVAFGYEGLALSAQPAQFLDGSEFAQHSLGLDENPVDGLVSVIIGAQLGGDFAKSRVRPFAIAGHCLPSGPEHLQAATVLLDAAVEGIELGL